MIKEDSLNRNIGADLPAGTRSPAFSLWQPAIAFVALTLACLFAIIPTHKVCTAARILGEHWYSIYNFMLAFAAWQFFAAARRENRPELAWRVWDLTLCCAILSLGFKLVPLPRPDGGPHGFPSGHTLTAFATSCLLLRYFPKFSPYAFAIAVAVGWSRVEIREHFVYQVLVGAVIGAIVGIAVSQTGNDVGVLLPRLIRRHRPDRAGSPPAPDQIHSE